MKIELNKEHIYKAWEEIDKSTISGNTCAVVMELMNRYLRPGHWKKVSFDKYIDSAGYHYTCDQCGKFKVGKSNYCPNCGARMESEVS